jgi:hypothetical protein
MNAFRRVVAVSALLLAPLAAHAQNAETTEPSGPVKVIAPQMLQVTTAKGTGMSPLYVSRDWSKPQPDVTRALLVFHGRLRNADVYNASGQKAIASAGAEGKTTILITPQFLTQMDIDAFHLPPAVLRWTSEGWMSGEDALAPAAISPFTIIDMILKRLSDRTIFPNLKEVVLAGHSAGGQVMQRYAVVGRGESALTAEGIHVRYVVSNPSSYVYFSADRPDGKGGFAPFDASSCKKFNRWKYGIIDPPPYVGSTSFADIEATYAHRDVTYLLGGADTDPNHPVLDKTCSGEAEGPYRLARGTSYLHYMQMRHPDGLTQKAWEVPGVGHDGDKMFNSKCGLTALFDIGKCTTPIP